MPDDLRDLIPAAGGPPTRFAHAGRQYRVERPAPGRVIRRSVGGRHSDYAPKPLYDGCEAGALAALTEARIWLQPTLTRAD